MIDYFKPYEGDKPFFFVSYSHRNSNFVLETIRPLREKGYRLWYDEGIPAGGDWPKNIEQHMQRCTMVLFFQSQTALASPNCWNEIKTAYNTHKTILRICLDDAQPAKEWAAALEQAVDVSGSESPKALAEMISRQPEMAELLGEESDYEDDTSNGRRAGVLDFLIAVLLVALLGLGTVSYFQWRTNQVQEPTVITKRVAVQREVPEVDLGQWKEMLQKHLSFPDAQQENAVRNLLGIYEGEIESEELEKITSLHFCGNMSLMDGLNGITYSAEDGWRVNGSAVIEGRVTDLTLIGQMLNLQTLSLVYQPVHSLDQLKIMPYLTELNLAGCGNVRLDTLPELTALETLHLEHSCVKDLTSLSSQPSLQSVTVSADMFPMTLEQDAAYDVVLVK